MNAGNVLKLIHLTEKANKLSSTLGQYTFEVFSSATKHTVAKAVENAVTLDEVAGIFHQLVRVAFRAPLSRPLLITHA